jgi:diguanylate cyclase (GGDEF)-like protein
LRKHDVVGRWGGEEFVAIFSNVDDEGLKLVTEKIRVLVGTSRLKLLDKEIQVTISIGATISIEGDTVENIVKRSDELMYRSKSDGRNRTTIG